MVFYLADPFLVIPRSLGTARLRSPSSGRKPQMPTPAPLEERVKLKQPGATPRMAEHHWQLS